MGCFGKILADGFDDVGFINTVGGSPFAERSCLRQSSLVLSFGVHFRR